MEELLKLIETRKTFLFTDLFEGKQVTVRLLVATFIAVLELTRLKKLRVRQDEAYADIHVEAVENTINADGTLAEGQLNFAPVAPSSQPAPAAIVAIPSASEEVAPVAEPLFAPAETPPLVLTATGYAEIPSVIGADAPAPAEPALEDTAPDSPTAEPELAPPLSASAPADEPQLASATLAPDESQAAPPASTPAPEQEVAAAQPAPAAEPLAAIERNTSAPAQILPQNPLDTEPPRDTLAT